MSLEKPTDFGTDAGAQVRRWLKEIELSDKSEKEWRADSEKIWKRYRGTQRKRNSFNILWSNTETLAPALFNTPPAPDVRRRFRDEDPIGKTVAQMLERCLEFQTDTEQFMHNVKQDVLDAILPGRGVSRIKYVPAFAPAPVLEGEQPELPADNDATPQPVEDEEVLAWEQCEIEHVQWDDFRRGPGKTWAEVCWVAFRHRMNREELTELAGADVAKLIALDQTDDDTLNKDEELKTVFSTAVVWEIWSKEERTVFYVAPGYRQKFLKEIDDPLKLIDFFPVPRPLYAIADSSSLIPTALYSQYEEQANELDLVSTRINKVINALRVRGLYDSSVDADIEQLLRGDDNKLIPIQNAAMWADKGGIEKAIYWMPIEQAAMVLKELYIQRDATKQVIYELSGIADVRRGTSDPGETLGAQKLKADFGNQRISGLKLEVERYVRDLMRLMSEVISTKFQPDTLMRMSQLKIPTNAEIDQKAQELLQQQGQQAQAQAQPGQPVPAPDPSKLPPRPISIEQVMECLHDDATRMFKIDVETDSMVSATAAEDMAGLRDVLTGVSQTMQAFAPAVQAGVLPVEAVKQILMVICRRSKMGSAVEDELDKIQPPKDQGNPEQAKAQAAMQAAQVKAQSDQQVAQMKVQSDAQIAQIKAQAQQQIEAAAQQAQQQTDMIRQQAEAAQHQAKIDSDARFEQMKAMLDDERHQREIAFEQWKVEKTSETAITVAEVKANATLSAEQNAAADAAASD